MHTTNTRKTITRKRPLRRGGGRAVGLGLGALLGALALGADCNPGTPPTCAPRCAPPLVEACPGLCAHLIQEGGHCNNVAICSEPCAPGLSCVFNDRSDTVCTSLGRGLAAPCRPPSRMYYSDCSDRLYCHDPVRCPNPGGIGMDLGPRCALPRSLGESCDSDIPIVEPFDSIGCSPCAAGLLCDQGTCRLPCFPRLGGTDCPCDTCTADGGCASPRVCGSNAANIPLCATTCVPAGWSCGAGVACCAGLACTGGHCTPLPVLH